METLPAKYLEGSPEEVLAQALDRIPDDLAQFREMAEHGEVFQQLVESAGQDNQGESAGQGTTLKAAQLMARLGDTVTNLGTWLAQKEKEYQDACAAMDQSERNKKALEDDRDELKELERRWRPVEAVAPGFLVLIGETLPEHLALFHQINRQLYVLKWFYASLQREFERIHPADHQVMEAMNQFQKEFDETIDPDAAAWKRRFERYEEEAAIFCATLRDVIQRATEEIEQQLIEAEQAAETAGAVVERLAWLRDARSVVDTSVRWDVAKGVAAIERNLGRGDGTILTDWEQLTHRINELAEQLAMEEPTDKGVTVTENGVTDVEDGVGQVSTSQEGTPCRLPMSSLVEGNALKQAIEQAQPGERLYLAAGTYHLNSTLLIRKSLTLHGAGADKTILTYAGKEAMMIFAGNHEWRLQDLAVQYTGSHWDVNGVQITGGTMEINNCSFHGFYHEDQEADQDESSGYGYGMMISGDTRGTIQHSRFFDNLCGLEISEKAAIDAIGNTCYQQARSGIAYKDNSSGTLRQNECIDNGFGIIAETEGTVLIEKNRCWGNHIGIGYAGYDASSQGFIRENEMVDNEFGIYVIGESEPGPEVEGNICLHNESAIVVGEQAAGLFCQNACIQNKSVGILVMEQAQAVLEENYCAANGSMGICLQEESHGKVIDNVCHHNRQSGIKTMSKAPLLIQGNDCQQNLDAGIYLANESPAHVFGNHCSHNFWGICVAEKASPLLEDNYCHENQHGITFGDESRGTSTKNRCEANEMTGFYVLDFAQPTVKKNICKKNKLQSIAVMDHAGGYIAKNIYEMNGADEIFIDEGAKPKIV